MNRLSSCSRPVLSLMASATPRWWPSALARRVFLFVAASNPPDRIVSQFPHGSRNITTVSRVQVDKSGKPYGRLPISPSGKVITISQDNDHYGIDQGKENIMTDNSKKSKNIGTSGTISEAIYEDDRSDKDASRTTSEVIDGKGYTWGQNVDLTGCDEDRRSAAKDLTVEIVVSEEEGYAVNDILAQSRHRDGSIYRGMDLSWWKKEYRIADRSETRLEPMTLSDPANCIIHDGTCMTHDPCSMLQFFSVELAKIPLDGGLVELYGYIAVRDDLDPLLNYIVNISRDDPIIVEQGSLINMTGPKRGIDVVDSALIEYDMKFKTGEQEKDDIQLIDGASIIGAEGSWDQPFIFRIPGDGGAVDITLSCLLYAVEATVEVLISEVQSSFNLSLECLTSGFDEEILLFDGTVAESCGLKRSVLAVLKNSVIDLKFKVGALSYSPDQHCRSFNAKTHGHDTQEIKTDFASISVKVTWSTLPGGSLPA